MFTSQFIYKCTPRKLYLSIHRLLVTAVSEHCAFREGIWDHSLLLSNFICNWCFRGRSGIKDLGSVLSVPSKAVLCIGMDLHLGLYLVSNDSQDHRMPEAERCLWALSGPAPAPPEPLKERIHLSREGNSSAAFAHYNELLPFAAMRMRSTRCSCMRWWHMI